MRILRAPTNVEIGGGTKIVTPPDFDKMPDFSASPLEDFEVQQLPEQGIDTTKKEESVEKTPSNKESEKVSSNKEQKAVEEPAEKKELEVKKPEVPEAKEKDILKILKAPQKKEEKKEPEAKGKTAPITPVVKETDRRDYSTFTQEEAALLKQMSNPAFELASRLIKENKELGTLRNTTYLQHEHAYLLDPQFQSLRTDVAFAVKEAQYWESQLEAISAGKPWRPITSWDQQGNPILGAEQEVSKTAEERIRLAMNRCYQVANEKNGTLQQYPTRYKQQVTQDLQAIDMFKKQQFAWHNQPELMDYTVPIDGMGSRSLKQIKEDVKGLLPVYMRNHPLADLVGDLAIAVRIQAGQLAEATNNNAVQAIKKEEQQHIEPSSKEKKSSTEDNNEEVHGIKTFSIDPSLGI